MNERLESHCSDTIDTSDRLTHTSYVAYVVLCNVYHISIWLNIIKSYSRQIKNVSWNIDGATENKIK